jgi:ABC-type histidine transport system ATPase subunit
LCIPILFAGSYPNDRSARLSGVDGNQVGMQFADEGMTMVVVTHEMTFARRVAHRVVVFKRGAIVEHGPPQQVFETPQTERTRAFLSHLTWTG